jgi:hypothetical protein
MKKCTECGREILESTNLTLCADHHTKLVQVHKLVKPERCENCGRSATVQVIIGDVDHYVCNRAGCKIHQDHGPILSADASHITGVKGGTRYCYRLPAY